MPQDPLSSSSVNVITSISPQECFHALWNTPVGFCKTTFDGRPIFTNPALASLLGYASPEELLSSVKDLASQVYADPQDRESFKELLQRRMEILNHECRLLRRNGDTIWVSINAQIVQDSSSRGTHIQSFMTDITARKRVKQALMENEDRFRQMFLNAPLPYQSLDELGNFLDVNKAFLELLGYSRQEVIDRNFTDFLHPDWLQHFQDNFLRFKAVGEILGVKFQICKKDGAYILINLNGRIHKDEQGRFQRAHCIFQDVTEKK